MKRIVFVSHSKNLYGAETVLLNVVKSLNSSYEIHVLLPSEGLLKERLDEVSGVKTHILWMPILTKRFPGSLVYILFYFITVFRLIYLFIRLSPHVIYNNALHNLYGSTAAYFLGIPNIWHIHEKYYGGLAGKILLWFVKRFSTKVIFISEFVKASFLEYAPGLEEKSQVIHNGIDLKVQKRNSSIPDRLEEVLHNFTEPVVIGTICQITEQKRPFDLVSALETLLKKYPQLILVFVGDGYYREELEKFIAGRKLNDHILVLGFFEDVQPILSRIDIFVCPFEGEGFGLVALEAMALKKSIVAANSGGLPEIIRDGENGLLFPVGNVEALVERIERLIESKNLCERLGERAYSDCLNLFSVSLQAEKISVEFERL